VRLNLGGWGSLPRWRRWLAVGLAFAWLFLVAGLLLVLSDDADVRSDGVLTTADVLDVESGTRVTDNADIRFKLSDGTEVRANIDIESARDLPVEGQAMEVRYDPTAPDETVVVAHVDRAVYWVEVAILSVIFVGLGGVGVAAVADIIEPSRLR